MTRLRERIIAGVDVKFAWDTVKGQTYQPEMAEFADLNAYRPLSSPMACLEDGSMWVETPGEGVFRVKAWVTIIGGSEGQDV